MSHRDTEREIERLERELGVGVPERPVTQLVWRKGEPKPLGWVGEAPWSDDHPESTAVAVQNVEHET